ncbi:hypothetical protein OF820_05670 [Oceanotoga sp. DSM 15011]|uniref:tetratricopeptide repeat protein n=1 Tax=Oceanotoga sp. DSM 15011 TaxID=2984951 RepID=UPI0021F3CFE5|nr:hypothetical protein [Oceanotoga sp. DSM 15011]UYP01173.1 hypothetical protein OF820_05670 [Oceanotoga sp. DSM 15011]
MRKIITFLFLITSILIFASLDDISEIFNKEDMIQSSDQKLQKMGYLLKHWEKNHSLYKQKADEIKINNFREDEKALINFMENIQPLVYIDPVAKLGNLYEQYPDSIAVKSLYLLYNVEYWKAIKDPKIAEQIISLSNEIENIKSKDIPLGIYAKSLIMWKSNIFKNEEIAYSQLKNLYINITNQKEILELLIEMNYQNKNNSLTKKLYKDYLEKPEKDVKTMIHLANLLYFDNDIEELSKFSEDLLNQYPNNSFVKKNIYEILGDSSKNIDQKVEYYKLASSSDPEDPNLLTKLGLSYYEQDPKENAKLVRIILNSSISKNPNQPEVEKILSKLRKNVIIKNFLFYMVPIILITAIGIFLLLKLEKIKKEKELKLMNDENDDNI